MRRGELALKLSEYLLIPGPLLAPPVPKANFHFLRHPVCS